MFGTSDPVRDEALFLRFLRNNRPGNWGERDTTFARIYSLEDQYLEGQRWNAYGLEIFDTTTQTGAYGRCLWIGPVIPEVLLQGRSSTVRSWAPQHLLGASSIDVHRERYQYRPEALPTILSSISENHGEEFSCASSQGNAGDNDVTPMAEEGFNDAGTADGPPDYVHRGPEGGNGQIDASEAPTLAREDVSERWGEDRGHPTRMEQGP